MLVRLANPTLLMAAWVILGEAHEGVMLGIIRGLYGNDGKSNGNCYLGFRVSLTANLEPCVNPKP